MNKKDILNYLNGKISELNGIKEFIKDENSLNVINARVATLNETIEFVNKAEVPFDLI